MDLKLISYNCKGFSINKVSFINSLLNDCDILLLQETWLYSSQFVLFQKYFANRESHSIICGMDETVIQVGRPYGGVTLLYRKFKKVTEKTMSDITQTGHVHVRTCSTA